MNSPTPSSSPSAPSPTVPRSHHELQELLRAQRGPVRLVGSGSRQQRLPPAPANALHVALTGLATIERLDGPDQTCSVDCGVLRSDLDAALQPLGLELPCPGEGTLGGLFAADPLGAAAPGGQSPRTLLLGAEAVLADGTFFRSGARVVKSVAGFDVHKLAVGSEGRLFALTRLHLRLKPRPRAEQWFGNRGLSLADAIALVQRLRQLPTGLAALQLAWTRDGGCDVRGRLVGRPAFVRATLRANGLVESAANWRDHVAAASDAEVLATLALPAQLPALLAAAPSAQALLWHGGNRCEVAYANATDGDRALAALPKIPLAARLVVAAPPRRGLATACDPGVSRLTRELKLALDPHGRLV